MNKRRKYADPCAVRAGSCRSRLWRGLRCAQSRVPHNVARANLCHPAGDSDPTILRNLAWSPWDASRPTAPRSLEVR
jgi:hypothetical protein